MKTAESLRMALAAAIGVSDGSAWTIPSFLLPEMSGARCETLTDLRLDGEEAVNGYAAYKIEGKDRGGRKMMLWVDKESLLIVQTFERTTFADFETETTTIYKPQVNVDIPREKLDFNAPEKAR